MPVPERITPTARSPSSRASERKKMSIGSDSSRSSPLSESSSRPSEMIMSWRGGMRCTVSAFTGIPSRTRVTGSEVRRASSSSIIDSKSGERCCTTTKARPVSADMEEKSPSSASSPPAEAPTPTIIGRCACVSPTPTTLTVNHRPFE